MTDYRQSFSSSSENGAFSGTIDIGSYPSGINFVAPQYAVRALGVNLCDHIMVLPRVAPWVSVRCCQEGRSTWV